jgi:hypothetical protein
MTRSLTAFTLAACAIGLGAARGQEPAARPVGKWERRVGKNQVTVVVEDNRLHVTLTGEKSCTLHADYGMTRDQIVYGVVTSVECTDEDAGEAEKEMLDAPFSCRFRVDEGVLIIRDVKFGAGDDKKDSLWGGRFKAVPGAQPPQRVTASAPADPLLRTPASVPVQPPPPPATVIPPPPPQPSR